MAFGSSQRLAALRRATLDRASGLSNTAADYGIRAGEAMSQYGRDLEGQRQFDELQKLREAREARAKAEFAEKQKADLERLAMQAAAGKMAGMRLQGGPTAPPGMGGPGEEVAPPSPAVQAEAPAPQGEPEIEGTFEDVPESDPGDVTTVRAAPAPAPAAPPPPAVGLQAPDLSVAASPINESGLDPTQWRQFFIGQGIEPGRAETLADNFVAEERASRSMSAVKAAAEERARRQKDFDNQMELASKKSIMAKREVERQFRQAELHDALNSRFITESDAEHLDDFREKLSRAHQFKESDPKWMKYLSLVGEQTYGKGFKYTGDPEDPRQDAVRQAANEMALDYAKGAAEGQIKGPEDLIRALKPPKQIKGARKKVKRINLLKELPTEMQKSFGVVESAEDFRKAATKLKKIPKDQFKIGFAQKMLTELQGMVGDVRSISDEEIELWDAKGSHSFAITAHIRRISGAAVTDGEALRVLQTVGGDLDKLDGPTVARILESRADDFERNSAKSLVAAIGTGKGDEEMMYRQAEEIAAGYGAGFLRLFRQQWKERERLLGGATKQPPRSRAEEIAAEKGLPPL